MTSSCSSSDRAAAAWPSPPAPAAARGAANHSSNDAAESKTFGSTKLRRAHSSPSEFCRGVPVSRMRWAQRKVRRVTPRRASAFFRLDAGRRGAGARGRWPGAAPAPPSPSLHGTRTAHTHPYPLPSSPVPLVHDQQAPRHRAKHARVSQSKVVVRDEGVEAARRQRPVPQGPALVRGAIVQDDRQGRRPSRKLGHPVGQDGLGRQDDVGARGPPVIQEVGDESNCLHRLAQALGTVGGTWVGGREGAWAVC